MDVAILCSTANARADFPSVVENGVNPCGAAGNAAGQVEQLEDMVASSKSMARGSHREEAITKSTGPLSSSGAPTKTASGPCMQVAEIPMVRTVAMPSASL